MHPQQLFADQVSSEQWLSQKFGKTYSLDTFLKMHCVGIHNRDFLCSSGDPAIKSISDFFLSKG